jgi:hypothetical protein
MNGETTLSILAGVPMGVAGTVAMDVLGSLARKAGLAAGPKGKWVGRWYIGMARGQFVHADIAASPEQAGEMQAAFVGHYVIGVTLAVFYVVAAIVVGVPRSSFVAAVGYGLATCVFPWLLVFPAFGFGAFGRKGPAELKLFTSSLLNHLFYGLGLWLTAYVLASA